jgi:hypothetical protein
MGTKQVVIGVAIFTIVTIVLFFLFSQVLKINEVISVSISIVGGLGAEILYRKKKLGQ